MISDNIYEARNNLFFDAKFILILIKYFIKVVRPNHTFQQNFTSI